MRSSSVISLLVLLVAPAVVTAPARSEAVDRGAARTQHAAGTWRRLPPAPIAPVFETVGVWTGRQMLVFGRAQPKPPTSVDVAAAYTPATNTWRRLAPLAGPTGNYEGRYWTVWTGREMLVYGPFDFQAFNPAANRWRRVVPKGRSRGAGGLVVWTGREMIDWGGGCCGDASSAGGAYDPTTNTWRPLASSPLAPSQRPIGAWTGTEVIVFVSGLDPDGNPYPARLARAAAYNPTTDTWRRIAPLPAPREDATAVWDGSEVLVVGGAARTKHVTVGPWPLARVGLAYNPAKNRWRKLPPMASGRMDFASVWTGKELLVWGGRTTLGFSPQSPPTGLAYKPTTNRWSSLPQAPLLGRLGPTAVWTGQAMIVWGGWKLKKPEGSGSRSFSDGAAFTPARP